MASIQGYPAERSRKSWGRTAPGAPHWPIPSWPRQLRDWKFAPTSIQPIHSIPIRPPHAASPSNGWSGSAAAAMLEHAMKAADNLVHAGGFGVVVLDLCPCLAAGRRAHSAFVLVPFPPRYRKHAVDPAAGGTGALAKSCASLRARHETQQSDVDRGAGVSCPARDRSQSRRARNRQGATGLIALRMAGSVLTMYACVYRETAATGLARSPSRSPRCSNSLPPAQWFSTSAVCGGSTVAAPDRRSIAKQRRRGAMSQ